MVNLVIAGVSNMPGRARRLQFRLCAGQAVLVSLTMHGALMVRMACHAVITLAKLGFHTLNGKRMATSTHINTRRTGERLGSLAIGHTVTGLATYKGDAMLAFIPFLRITWSGLDMTGIAVAIHVGSLKMFGSLTAQGGESPSHIHEIAA